MSIMRPKDPITGQFIAVNHEPNCTCATCGKRFDRSPAHIQRQADPTQVYCCQACARIGRRQSLIGESVDRLTVIALYESGNGANRWLCQCKCGNSTILSTRQLNARRVKSCGCLLRDTIRTHGMAHTAEYRIFQLMHQRCENPRNTGYEYYGARGITVDPRWGTFEQFFADKGFRPSPAHTLDRIDNDGPYSPENTRWATPIQQHRNTRRNRRVTIDGTTHCYSEWAELSSIDAQTIRQRSRSATPTEDILNPARLNHRGSACYNAKLTEDTARTLYALKGTMLSKEAAPLFGIHYTTVNQVWNKRTWRHIHEG